MMIKTAGAVVTFLSFVLLGLSAVAECKVIGEDVWHGYKRTLLDFDGYSAWIVEPKVAPAEGRPWTWTMQWADAFVDRTGVLDLLAKGWHHVTIDTFKHRMNDEGVRVSRSFQKYLVEQRSFAPKACLVGMSWGGFFSMRYAAAHPDCVAKVWLDGPLLTFDGFDVARIGPWANEKPHGGSWATDERMPINLAGKILEAKIPILLYYGGQDKTVAPQKNAEALWDFYKKAGEVNKLLGVKPRPFFGHHPHGDDPDKTTPIVNFFEKK
ncbi:MAG: alpha/beta fold hydrolase [Kiritimatiellae bacterium]|nr:alpha/beta fold hydrolase [Kiritimatiellia bacterium]